MGLLSALQSLFGIGRRQVNIIVVGLDNSGKSTILNFMKGPEAKTTQIVPTVGYATSTFQTGNVTFSAFDMSGQGKYRNLWESYYASSEGIVFVVDSSDRLRMAVARDELWLLLDHKDLAHKKMPLLVLANKMDEKDALTSAEISQHLGLDLIRGRPWHIQSTCALEGTGLQPAIEWLTTNVKQYLDSR